MEKVSPIHEHDVKDLFDTTQTTSEALVPECSQNSTEFTSLFALGVPSAVSVADASENTASTIHDQKVSTHGVKNSLQSNDLLQMNTSGEAALDDAFDFSYRQIGGVKDVNSSEDSTAVNGNLLDLFDAPVANECSNVSLSSELMIMDKCGAQSLQDFTGFGDILSEGNEIFQGNETDQNKQKETNFLDVFMTETPSDPNTTNFLVAPNEEQGFIAAEDTSQGSSGIVDLLNYTESNSSADMNHFPSNYENRLVLNNNGKASSFENVLIPLSTDQAVPSRDVTLPSESSAFKLEKAENDLLFSTDNDCTPPDDNNSLVIISSKGSQLIDFPSFPVAKDESTALNSASILDLQTDLSTFVSLSNGTTAELASTEAVVNDQPQVERDSVNNDLTCANDTNTLESILEDEINSPKSYNKCGMNISEIEKTVSNDVADDKTFGQESVTSESVVAEKQYHRSPTVITVAVDESVLGIHSSSHENSGDVNDSLLLATDKETLHSELLEIGGVPEAVDIHLHEKTESKLSDMEEKSDGDLLVNMSHSNEGVCLEQALGFNNMSAESESDEVLYQDISIIMNTLLDCVVCGRSSTYAENNTVCESGSALFANQDQNPAEKVENLNFITDVDMQSLNAKNLVNDEGITKHETPNPPPRRKKSKQNPQKENKVDWKQPFTQQLLGLTENGVTLNENESMSEKPNDLLLSSPFFGVNSLEKESEDVSSVMSNVVQHSMFAAEPVASTRVEADATVSAKPTSPLQKTNDNFESLAENEEFLKESEGIKHLPQVEMHAPALPDQVTSSSFDGEIVSLFSSVAATKVCESSITTASSEDSAAIAAVDIQSNGNNDATHSNASTLTETLEANNSTIHDESFMFTQENSTFSDIVDSFSASETLISRDENKWLDSQGDSNDSTMFPFLEETPDQKNDFSGHKSSFFDQPSMVKQTEAFVETTEKSLMAVNTETSTHLVTDILTQDLIQPQERLNEGLLDLNSNELLSLSEEQTTDADEKPIDENVNLPPLKSDFIHKVVDSEDDQKLSMKKIEDDWTLSDQTDSFQSPPTEELFIMKRETESDVLRSNDYVTNTAESSTGIVLPANDQISDQDSTSYQACLSNEVVNTPTTKMVEETEKNDTVIIPQSGNDFSHAYESDASVFGGNGSSETEYTRPNILKNTPKSCVDDTVIPQLSPGIDCSISTPDSLLVEPKSNNETSAEAVDAPRADTFKTVSNLTKSSADDINTHTSSEIEPLDLMSAFQSDLPLVSVSQQKVDNHSEKVAGESILETFYVAIGPAVDDCFLTGTPDVQENEKELLAESTNSVVDGEHSFHASDVALFASTNAQENSQLLPTSGHTAEHSGTLSSAALLKEEGTDSVCGQDEKTSELAKPQVEAAATSIVDAQDDVAFKQASNGEAFHLDLSDQKSEEVGNGSVTIEENSESILSEVPTLPSKDTPVETVEQNISHFTQLSSADQVLDEISVTEKNLCQNNLPSEEEQQVVDAEQCSTQNNNSESLANTTVSTNVVENFSSNSGTDFRQFSVASDDSSVFGSDNMHVSDIDSSSEDEIEIKQDDNISQISLEFDDNPFSCQLPTAPPRAKKKSKDNIASSNRWPTNATPLTLVPSTVFIDDDLKDDVEVEFPKRSYDDFTNRHDVTELRSNTGFSETQDLLGRQTDENETFVSFDEVGWDEIQLLKPSVEVMPVIAEVSEPEDDYDDQSEKTSHHKSTVVRENEEKSNLLFATSNDSDSQGTKDIINVSENETNASNAENVYDVTLNVSEADMITLNQENNSFGVDSEPCADSSSDHSLPLHKSSEFSTVDEDDTTTDISVASNDTEPSPSKVSQSEDDRNKFEVDTPAIEDAIRFILDSVCKSIKETISPSFDTRDEGTCFGDQYDYAKFSVTVESINEAAIIPLPSNASEIVDFHSCNISDQPGEDEVALSNTLAVGESQHSSSDRAVDDILSPAMLPNSTSGSEVLSAADNLLHDEMLNAVDSNSNNVLAVSTSEGTDSLLLQKSLENFNFVKNAEQNNVLNPLPKSDEKLKVEKSELNFLVNETTEEEHNSVAVDVVESTDEDVPRLKVSLEINSESPPEGSLLTCTSSDDHQKTLHPQDVESMNVEDLICESPQLPNDIEENKADANVSSDNDTVVSKELKNADGSIFNETLSKMDSNKLESLNQQEPASAAQTSTFGIGSPEMTEKSTNDDSTKTKSTKSKSIVTNVAPCEDKVTPSSTLTFDEMQHSSFGVVDDSNASPVEQQSSHHGFKELSASDNLLNEEVLVAVDSNLDGMKALPPTKGTDSFMTGNISENNQIVENPELNNIPDSMLKIDEKLKGGRSELTSSLNETTQQLHSGVVARVVDSTGEEVSHFEDVRASNSENSSLSYIPADGNQKLHPYNVALPDLGNAMMSESTQLQTEIETYKAVSDISNSSEVTDWRKLKSTDSLSEVELGTLQNSSAPEVSGTPISALDVASSEMIEQSINGVDVSASEVKKSITDVVNIVSGDAHIAEDFSKEKQSLSDNFILEPSSSHINATEAKDFDTFKSSHTETLNQIDNELISSETSVPMEISKTTTSEDSPKNHLIDEELMVVAAEDGVTKQVSDEEIITRESDSVSSELKNVVDSTQTQLQISADLHTNAAAPTEGDILQKSLIGDTTTPQRFTEELHTGGENTSLMSTNVQNGEASKDEKLIQSDKKSSADNDITTEQQVQGVFINEGGSNLDNHGETPHPICSFDEAKKGIAPELLEVSYAKIPLKDSGSEDTPRTKKKLELELDSTNNLDESNESIPRKPSRTRHDTIGSLDLLSDSEEELENVISPLSELSSDSLLVTLDNEKEDFLPRPPPVLTSPPKRRRSLVPPSALVLSVALDDIQVKNASTTSGNENKLHLVNEETVVFEGDSQLESVSFSSEEAASEENVTQHKEKSELPTQKIFDSFSIPQLTPPQDLKRPITWETVVISNVDYKVDATAIQPFKRVISHGGFYKEKNTIVEIFARYLPDSSVPNYTWVMDNLFLYILSTMELLVQNKEYVIVFFNNSVSKSHFPSTAWLKKSHVQIPPYLRKNLKGFYVVQPSFYLKTLIGLTRMFINRKAFKKIKHVKNHMELKPFIPIDFLFVPEEVARGK